MTKLFLPVLFCTIWLPNAVANLFPVSTFDMGLLIAGTSPTGYLGMLKVDGTVKLIFVLVLLFDLIHYGASRLILLLL